MEYMFDTLYLKPAEYAKIYSEINTNYFKYIGHLNCIHRSYDDEGNPCRYYFENHGFNKYNVYAKIYV